MSFPQQQNLKNSFVDFNTIKPVNVLKPEATEKKFQNFSRIAIENNPQRDICKKKRKVVF